MPNADTTSRSNNNVHHLLLLDGRIMRGITDRQTDIHTWERILLLNVGKMICFQVQSYAESNSVNVHAPTSVNECDLYVELEGVPVEEEK